MDNQKIIRKTVVDQVMERIRDLIFSGEYKVGDKLPNESVLAERFGIGRSSVREAVKILHYIGVLDSSTGRRTFVRDWRNISTEVLSWTCLLSEKDYFDLMDLRYSIEENCICQLTEEYGAGLERAGKTIELLEKTVQSLLVAAESMDRPVLMSGDFEFHYQIIKNSENPVFLMIYQLLRSFMVDANGELLRRYEEPIEIYREHKEILDAVKTGNMGMASSAIYLHIEDSKIRLHTPLLTSN